MNECESNHPSVFILLISILILLCADGILCVIYLLGYLGLFYGP